ncbi:MAG: ThiF family adenylyltransferase [Actinomycetota bacterium]
MRISTDHWNTIRDHLDHAGSGERFGFALTEQLATAPDGGPVLRVVDTLLVADDETTNDDTGWYVADTAVDRVHNHATTRRLGLVEFHNHHIGPPGFSHTDEAAIDPMATYAVDLLGQTYGAAVYADEPLDAEVWYHHHDGIARRPISTVVVADADRLRVLNARPRPGNRFNRQDALLGPHGQATLAGLRIALIGAGGTGAHVATGLAHLGARNVLVLDDDIVEDTNMNRLVTATAADIGAPKNLVARRRMLEIDTTMNVVALPGLTIDGDHPELQDVDLIIGCVDHDGPRDRLNQLAVTTNIPYIDLATGLDPSTHPPALGGRIIVVAPDGPCLHCHHELDAAEIADWAKPPEQRAIDHQHGYGTSSANPSVVHLNGIAAYSALAELAAWVSETRPPAQRLDLDLNGHLTHPDAPAGSRLNPANHGRRTSCHACG